MITRETWREVGEAFATPWEERTGKHRGMTTNGLCWSLYPIAERSDYFCEFDLIKKLGGYRGRHYGNGGEFADYWLPPRSMRMGEPNPEWTPLCDDIRALFAFLMAELSEDEYVELIGEKK